MALLGNSTVQFISRLIISDVNVVPVFMFSLNTTVILFKLKIVKTVGIAFFDQLGEISYTKTSTSECTQITQIVFL